MVVPAGEQTISLSSPGCFPVSRTIFAEPKTACAANLYALSLGIPDRTAASAMASMNMKTYAGLLPVSAVTSLIRPSSSSSAFPEYPKSSIMLSFSWGDWVPSKHTRATPSPTRAGVLGMVRTTLVLCPSMSLYHDMGSPTTMVTRILLPRTFPISSRTAFAYLGLTARNMMSEEQTSSILLPHGVSPVSRASWSKASRLMS